MARIVWFFSVTLCLRGERLRPQLSIHDNLAGAFRTIHKDSIRNEVKTMLWTLFVILLVLWLIGVVSSYTLGGFIHILLVLALIALVFQLLSGRRTV